MKNFGKFAMIAGGVIAIFLLGYLWSEKRNAAANIAHSETSSESEPSPALESREASDAGREESGDTASELAFGQDYERYPVQRYNGPLVPLNLRQDQKAYVTRLNNAHKEPANYGGSLVLTQFGCGTGCSFVFAVDKSSGRVLDFPVGGEYYQGLQIYPKVDSALVWASWYTDAGWEECRAQAWKLGSGGFVEETSPFRIDCAAKDRLVSI